MKYNACSKNKKREKSKNKKKCIKEFCKLASEVNIAIEVYTGKKDNTEKIKTLIGIITLFPTVFLVQLPAINASINDRFKTSAEALKVALTIISTLGPTAFCATGGGKEFVDRTIDLFWNLPRNVGRFFCGLWNRCCNKKTSEKEVLLQQTNVSKTINCGEIVHWIKHTAFPVAVTAAAMPPSLTFQIENGAKLWQIILFSIVIPPVNIKFTRDLYSELKGMFNDESLSNLFDDLQVELKSISQDRINRIKEILVSNSSNNSDFLSFRRKFPKEFGLPDNNNFEQSNAFYELLWKMKKLIKEFNIKKKDITRSKCKRLFSSVSQLFVGIIVGVANAIGYYQAKEETIKIFGNLLGCISTFCAMFVNFSTAFVAGKLLTRSLIDWIFHPVKKIKHIMKNRAIVAANSVGFVLSAAIGSLMYTLYYYLVMQNKGTEFKANLTGLANGILSFYGMTDFTPYFEKIFSKCCCLGEENIKCQKELDLLVGVMSTTSSMIKKMASAECQEEILNILFAKEKEGDCYIEIDEKIINESTDEGSAPSMCVDIPLLRLN